MSTFDFCKTQKVAFLTGGLSNLYPCVKLNKPSIKKKTLGALCAALAW